MRLTWFCVCVLLSTITSPVIGAPIARAPAEVGIEQRLLEDTLHEDVHRGIDEVTSTMRRRSPEGEMWKNNVHEEVRENAPSASPTPSYSRDKRLSPVAISDELQA